MRVLHIWDICENSALISDKLTALGHKSFVVHRKRMTVSLICFIFNVIYHLLTFKADIIHINAWDKGILPAKLLSPKSKILMHYHGSDILNKKISLAVQLFANLICVSTKNLIDKCAPFPVKILPVLVSEEFYYRGGREKGVIIELIPRTQNIPYELMPFILSLGEYYRDKKRINVTNSQILSKTGMEAIKCGTKVITDSGEIVENYPMVSFNDYSEAYNELCGIYPSL